MSDPSFEEFAPVTAEEWRQKIIEDLKGKSFEDLIWHTKEGFAVQPFYTAEDLEKIKITPHSKSSSTWEIRQYLVVKNIEECNSLIREALKGGAESIGLDVSGVEISSEVLQKLTEGINPESTPVHITGPNPESWFDFIDWLETRPNSKGSLCLSRISIDKLKQISKLAPSFPNFDFITIRNAEDTETITERITFLLDEAKGFVDASKELGLPVKNILPTIRFDILLSTDYFMEIAALRALRELWSEEIKKYSDEEIPIFIHAENILQETREEESHLNILRATTTAMSAVIGGCDSLTLKASPIKGKSGSFSERIFRNIQLLLKHESYFDKINDPAKGSFYIETLTSKLMESVKRNF